MLLESKYVLQINSDGKKDGWYTPGAYGSFPDKYTWKTKPGTKRFNRAVEKFRKTLSFKGRLRSRLVLVEKTRV